MSWTNYSKQTVTVFLRDHTETLTDVTSINEVGHFLVADRDGQQRAWNLDQVVSFECVVTK